MCSRRSELIYLPPGMQRGMVGNPRSHPSTSIKLLAANLSSHQEAGGSRAQGQILCKDFHFQASLGFLTPCFIKPMTGAREVAELKEQTWQAQSPGSHRHINQVWFCIPVILTLRGWKQEDQKFMVILGYRLS